MGLHAQIHQVNRDVSIALTGEFRTPEFTQLHAILQHFHHRGCRRFLLDLSKVSPLTPAAEATLNRLIGNPQRSQTPELRGSAIRLLAESPAVPPQMGCGGLVFSTAS
jgi:hypothetical protein